MKKALIFLTSLLTLLVSFAHPSDAPLSALAAETSGENIYTSSFFDFDTETLGPVSFYESENESTISTEAKELNEAMTTYAMSGNIKLGYSDPSLFVSKTQDVLPLVLNQLLESNSNPDYVVNSLNNTTFLKAEATSEDDIDEYIGLYYQIAKPIVYFDSAYKDNISFYIRPFNKGTLLKLVNKYKLSGEMTLLQIDEDPIITLKLLENDFQLVTQSNVSITAEKRRVLTTGNRYIYPIYLKVTMPHRDSILGVSLLNLVALDSESRCLSFEPNDDLRFAFHSSVIDRAYFYNFNIKSLSIINRTLLIDENSYTRITLPNNEEIDSTATVTAQPVSMKLLFTGAIRSKTETVGALKSTQLGKIGQEITIFSIPTTKEYECTFTSQSESSKAWSYTCEDLPATASGQITIQSISFHPVINGSVREDITFTQDFSKTNLYKYSFDAKKAARIYYYNWEGYYRAFSANDDSTDDIFKGTNIIATDVGSSSLKWLYDQKYNYHCFGFSFYFDDDKTESIPNVQKIRLKWQCGYKVANSDPESGGFYANTNDKAKNIHIEEKEVNANKKFNSNTYALDKDGMFLSDKDSCNKAFTQNGRFDYVVAKLRKRGDKTYNSYISAMAPLEIFYETITGEVVRMIGNSKGLHVVTDELGNDIVVNSEGIAPTDETYGIYEAEDGTKYPGIDRNGDGKITADEVINSDTGEGANLANPNDSTFITDLENALSGFFNNLTELFKSPRSWLLAILAIILIASIVVSILNPASLISIFKTIKNAFQSLFSKVKKKTSKKVKKKRIKSKRKKR